MVSKRRSIPANHSKEIPTSSRARQQRRSRQYLVHSNRPSMPWKQTTSSCSKVAYSRRMSSMSGSSTNGQRSTRSVSAPTRGSSTSTSICNPHHLFLIDPLSSGAKWRTHLKKSCKRERAVLSPTTGVEDHAVFPQGRDRICDPGMDCPDLGKRGRHEDINLVFERHDERIVDSPAFLRMGRRGAFKGLNNLPERDDMEVGRARPGCTTA